MSDEPQCHFELICEADPARGFWCPFCGLTAPPLPTPAARINRRCVGGGDGVRPQNHADNLLDVLPCVHRREELRKERSDICGCPEPVEPIFACGLGGECSLRTFAFGPRQPRRRCLTCGDRKEY